MLTPCLNSLQLNIGIIAACASFLKPLVGHILKLNSTAASYPSYPQYNRSNRTHRGSRYAAGSRRAGASDTGAHDDFELQYKTNILALERQGSPSPARLQAGHAATGGNSPSGADYKDHPSDTNSDDILLHQVEPAHGIVRTREYSVKYSERQRLEDILSRGV